MTPLWQRLDVCDRTDNADLSAAFCEWLSERLTQDDVLAELRRVLPGVSEGDLLRAVGAIAWQVNRP